MNIESKYDNKRKVLTITCDKKDIILAFENEDNYYEFIEKLVDEYKNNFKYVKKVKLKIKNDII